MATLDIALSIIFVTLSLAGLAGAIFCFRKALTVSGERDGDIKMFFWAVGSMAALIISGMSAAYILLPILFHYTK